jgi:hypothetical protein
MSKQFTYFGILLAILALALLVGPPAQAGTLAGRVELGVTANYTKTTGLTTSRDRLEKTFEQLFSSGTGSGQANVLWHGERTLADGASENLDLAGILTDAFGDTVTLAKCKGLIIANKSTTQTISVGGAAATQFVAWVGSATDYVKVAPGGVLALFNPGGYTVTAASADLLKIANSAGAAAIYDIIIIGSTS